MKVCVVVVIVVVVGMKSSKEDIKNIILIKKIKNEKSWNRDSRVFVCVVRKKKRERERERK